MAGAAVKMMNQASAYLGTLAAYHGDEIVQEAWCPTSRSEATSGTTYWGPKSLRKFHCFSYNSQFEKRLSWHEDYTISDGYPILVRISIHVWTFDSGRNIGLGASNLRAKAWSLQTGPPLLE